MLLAMHCEKDRLQVPRKRLEDDGHKAMLCAHEACEGA